MEAFNHEEYISRGRCNTWPLQQQPHINGEVFQNPKNEMQKNGGRKNPWGNRSYAELITDAIYSSPEGRMTLAQIYEWIIYNVPYFNQRTDSKSSAGWKNSVRHNLSLHNRFMKMQNEVQAKPSWWIINPSASNTKTRRRTASASNSCEGMRPKAKCRIESDQLNIQQIKNFLQYPYGSDFSHNICRQQVNSIIPINHSFHHQLAPNSIDHHQQISNTENIHQYFSNFNLNSQENEHKTIFDQDQEQTLQDIQEIINRDQNTFNVNGRLWYCG
ncbi:PREDICTED: forkhead box protein O-like [Nicrophorus vespilloides]|uniref:Forkhead box protein O n=1 Tax=Nicrophorus vespilloides TaxID=110193 RepID=A0ABM1M8G5_NICVS|nr:PREDICTED: forkhead box protein O-like [Nicrophorus vespilloides]